MAVAAKPNITELGKMLFITGSETIVNAIVSRANMSENRVSIAAKMTKNATA